MMISRSRRRHHRTLAGRMMGNPRTPRPTSSVTNRRRPLGLITTTTTTIAITVSRVILAVNNQMVPPVDSLVSLVALLLRSWSVVLRVLGATNITSAIITSFVRN